MWNTRVARGVLEVSDHLLVTAVVNMQVNWTGKKKSVRSKEQVDWQKLWEVKLKKKVWQQLKKLNEELERRVYGRDINYGITAVMVLWRLWRQYVVGSKWVVSSKKGDALWNDEIQEGVKKKTVAWRKMMKKGTSETGLPTLHMLFLVSIVPAGTRGFCLYVYIFINISQLKKKCKANLITE